jgi:hypothetical protein
VGRSVGFLRGIAKSSQKPKDEDARRGACALSHCALLGRAELLCPRCRAAVAEAVAVEETMRARAAKAKQEALEQGTSG